jgi:hypothetical protein
MSAQSKPIKYLDHPAPGWFVLDVMKKTWRKWDWVALMIDVDLEDLQKTAHVRERWLRIPGKHRSRESAWNALEDIMATRH